MEFDQLAARVDRLEHEHRRLKLAGGTVVAALLAVALFGAAMPQEIPDEIVARRVRVVDENGVARARTTAASFAYADESGNVIWQAPPQ